MSASRDAGVIRRSEQSLILRSSFLRPGSAVKVSAYSNAFIQLFSSPVFYIMVKKLSLLSLFLYQNMDAGKTGPDGYTEVPDRLGQVWMMIVIGSVTYCVIFRVKIGKIDVVRSGSLSKNTVKMSAD